MESETNNKLTNKKIIYIILLLMLLITPVILSILYTKNMLDYFTVKLTNETILKDYNSLWKNCQDRYPGRRHNERSFPYVCTKDIDNLKISNNEKNILKLRKYDASAEVIISIIIFLLTFTLVLKYKILISKIND